MGTRVWPGLDVQVRVSISNHEGHDEGGLFNGSRRPIW